MFWTFYILLVLSGVALLCTFAQDGVHLRPFSKDPNHQVGNNLNEQLMLDAVMIMLHLPTKRKSNNNESE